MVLPWGEKIKLTPGEWYLVEVTITPKKTADGRTKKLGVDVSVIENGFFSPLV
jgi:hypothetical protein